MHFGQKGVKPVLKIEGAIQTSLELSYDDLANIEGDAAVDDVSTLVPDRSGSAVRLKHLIEQSQPDPHANTIRFIASDGYAVKLRLASILPVGLLIYAVDNQPLTEKQGGPTRIVIPNSAECHTAELDFCANIKSLVKIEVIKETEST